MLPTSDIAEISLNPNPKSVWGQKSIPLQPTLYPFQSFSEFAAGLVGAKSEGTTTLTALVFVFLNSYHHFPIFICFPCAEKKVGN